MANNHDAYYAAKERIVAELAKRCSDERDCDGTGEWFE